MDNRTFWPSFGRTQPTNISHSSLLLAAVDISFALYAEQQQHRGIEISCVDSFGKGFPWQMGRFRAVTDCLLCGLSASIPRTITVQLRFPSKFSLGQFMNTFNYEHFSRGSADVYFFSARGGRFGQKGKFCRDSAVVCWSAFEGGDPGKNILLSLISSVSSESRIHLAMRVLLSAVPTVTGGEMSLFYDPSSHREIHAVCPSWETSIGPRRGLWLRFHPTLLRCSFIHLCTGLSSSGLLRLFVHRWEATVFSH